ncbi:MAG: YcgN family cysteine cluster protein, partial [Gammaproteobacteria bacterium]|nr:YcgN family cysteine cluster protein [Gammaproteobacteria bacterium]
MNTNTQQGFWKNWSLSEMSQDEWESLCDGCGRCCLHKLEDEDKGDLYYTNVACRLLDLKTCRCKHYPERETLVSDCICLKPSNMKDFHWLPPTCAYRLLNEGKELPKWHPLLSNNQESI